MSSARIGAFNEFLPIPAKPYPTPECSENNVESEQDMALRHDSDSRLMETLERLDRRLDVIEAADKNKIGGWLRPLIQGLGAAVGALIVVFGVSYIPRAQSDADRRTDKAESRLSTLEKDAERVTQLQAKYENIRTLYLIRFGEDPDQVTPETMRKKRR